MYNNLFILTTFAFIYGLAAKKIEASYISGPIIFVSFGMLLGQGGLGFLDIKLDDEMISHLAEFTLALVLFTDASMMKVKVVKENIIIPRRLLLLALPLTIGLGFIVAFVIFKEFLWIEALVLAVILAPTDAALGRYIITNTRIPSVIRESLNVESGLNDGICVPFLLLCFAFAVETAPWVEVFKHAYFIRSIGIGMLVGLGLALSANYFINKVAKLGWSGDPWDRVLVITLALSIFSLSQLLGGSGFIGCFSGGVLFGILARRHKLKLEVAAEGIGEIMILVTWVAFGAMVGLTFFTKLTPLMILYAVLSLTVIRMLPVALVLSGLHMNPYNRIFIGWFGPRGLASIVFTVLVLQQNFPHKETISIIAVCTILLSIVVHGFSANNALINRFVKSLDK